MKIGIGNIIPDIVSLPGQGGGGAGLSDFKMTIDTTKPGIDPSQFKLPLQTSANNFTIYWGDGLSQTVTTATDVTHIYAVSGVYEIIIEGSFSGIKFANGGDRQKILSIDQWGSNQWAEMEQAFRGCINMVANYTDQPDTSLVTTMSAGFADCWVFDGIIDFDTTNLAIASNFLLRNYVFNSPITFTNTTALNTVVGFLKNCSIYNLTPNIDLSNVTDISSMFESCTLFDSDISGFDISSVTAATDMLLLSGFSITNYNLLLPAWDAYGTSNVTFNAGTAHYSAGVPTDAKAAMVLRTWVITDGGTP